METIKQLGTYEIEVKLYAEVSTKLFAVIAEK
jgi:ribosomal protein L9